MEIVPNELNRASLAAQDRLAGSARATANAGVSRAGFASTQATMAAAASAAVFADALLGAVRSRVAEAKAATR